MRDNGSATTEWALLFVILALMTILGASAVLQVVNVELPAFTDTIQSTTSQE